MYLSVHRECEEYLSVYGEYSECMVVCGTQNCLRRRKETLGVIGEYAKRNKSVYISVNNNTKEGGLYYRGGTYIFFLRPKWSKLCSVPLMGPTKKKL